MIVGLLTYHWVANFGANLQALSSYRYLKNNGYNPVIINWIPDDLRDYYERTVPREQFEAHKKFAKENYDVITEVCTTSADIANVINRNSIDTVVIGSDAVFSIRPFLSRLYVGRRGVKILKLCSDAIFPNPFWGSFLEGVKHKVRIVSISASAQNSPYKMILPRERAKYRKALTRFDKITVRDVWTQNMVKFITGDNFVPDITPDPVFAFNYNVNPQKRSFVEKVLNITGKYVLVCMPSVLRDEKWLMKLETMFNESGIELVWMPKTNKQLSVYLKNQLHFPIDPLDWYDAIQYSEGYIGELMHPVLVSLHNCVPVFAFDTYGFKKNGKLNTLSSKTFQIMSRFDLISTNYYNRLYNEYPSPETVYHSIQCFNKDKVRTEADIMLGEYLNMMSNVLDL